MPTLTYRGMTWTVDHAVKGADYVHGYSSDGHAVVSIDNTSDFGNIEYDGVYLTPEACVNERCNEVVHLTDKLVRRDGTVLTAPMFGAAAESHEHAAGSITSGIFSITRGGTNASTAAGARQNINVIGLNPITSTADDTPDVWKGFGTGIAYFNKAGCIVDQPTTNGLIENKVYNNTVLQEWFVRGSQPRKLVRTGQAGSGWNSSWKEVSLSEQTLWNNGSPTSSFAAQTISISAISNFKMLRLEFKRKTDDGTGVTIVVPAEAARSYIVSTPYIISSNRHAMRTFNVDASSVSFGACAETNDANATTQYLVPTKIVGIS